MMQKVVWSVECVLLLAMLVWLWVSYLEVLQGRGKAEEKKAKRTRELQARTPEDCPDCLWGSFSVSAADFPRQLGIIIS